MTLTELARRTGLPYSTIKRWRVEGRLTSAELVGNQWLVSETEASRLERRFKKLEQCIREFDPDRAYRVRVAAGLSLSDMANAAGVGRADTVLNWEHGRYQPGGSRNRNREAVERYFKILDDLESRKRKIWPRNGAKPGNRLGARKRAAPATIGSGVVDQDQTAAD